MATKIKLNGPIMDNDTAQLYQWIGWDCVCPRKLEKALEEAGGDDVILEVNSPGGYCDYGFEMYRIIKEYEGKVTAHIVCAASAMTIVCCAADTVKMSDAAMYMIHNTSASGSGDYRDMISLTECLQQYNESAINVYEKRTGKSREKLQEMMDHTTWMSPQKAIDEGFADGYIFDKTQTDPDDPNSDQGNAQSSNINMQILNASVPLIEKDKAMELIAHLRLADAGMVGQIGLTKAEKQKSGEDAGSGIETKNNAIEKGGTEKMSLEELLKTDADAQAEYDAALEAARTDGTVAENKRLQDLDALSASVTPEILKKAKYGKDTERMDAAELAYQTLMKDGQKVKSYMTNAVEDSADSNVNDVGNGISDEAEQVDESVAMASYVNKKKGWNLDAGKGEK